MAVGVDDVVLLGTLVKHGWKVKDMRTVEREPVVIKPMTYLWRNDGLVRGWGGGSWQLVPFKGLEKKVFNLAEFAAWTASGKAFMLQASRIE